MLESGAWYSWKNTLVSFDAIVAKTSKDAPLFYIWLALRAALLPSDQEFVDILQRWHAFSSDSTRDSEVTVCANHQREASFREPLFFFGYSTTFFLVLFFSFGNFFFSADLKLHIPQNGSLKGSWRGIVDERKQYRAPLKWDLFLFLHILWDICSTIMSLLTGHSHRQTAFPSVSRRI